MDGLAAARAIEAAATMPEVSRVLTEFGSPHGHGTHVISPVATPEAPVKDGWFLVQNWPQQWHETYVAENFAAFDPIPHIDRSADHHRRNQTRRGSSTSRCERCAFTSPTSAGRSTRRPALGIATELCILASNINRRLR